MRTSIFSIATVWVLLSFVSTTYSQSKKAKPSIGIIAGGTLSNLSNYDAANRLGFVAGGYVEHKKSDKISFLTNITWAQRGAMAKGNLPSVKLGYITIPLMVKYNISDKVGISTGIGWDELMTVKGTNLKIYDDLRSSDWRVPFGVGYKISNNLLLGVTYNIGLTDITKNDTENINSNWGSFALAYIFKKNKAE